jgi:hypothetical protein
VAARLLATAAAGRAELGIVGTLHDPPRWEPLGAPARPAAASDWDAGAALSPEQAVSSARRSPRRVAPIGRSRPPCS